ncbi:glycosyltransferase family 4 protein [Candidatus Kuenenia sp.]|uniref:glycosyltransferase family 4 protein n=1 Tax=Candidatus Kuenenia sp. TaxID=2499824 RepID=UPI00322060AC
MKVSDVFYEDCTDEKAVGIAIYIRTFIKNATGIDFDCWSLMEKKKTITLGKNVVQTNVLVPMKKKYKFIPETIRTIYYIWLKLKEISYQKDAIIYHSTTYFWPYLFKKKTTPLVLIIHGTNMPITTIAVGKCKALFVAKSDSYAIKKADRVILVSQEGLNYYQNKYPNYAGKMRFYPTFVDSSIFYSEDMEESKEVLGLKGKTVLCYVGRLATQKKVALLIKIFKRILIKRRDCFLCIVGDGPDREKLLHLVEELKIKDSVHFHGNVPNQIVRTFFNASVVSFTLSYWEGTAKTILESLACGTPAIVSDVADNRQIITNGKDGFVLDSDDEEKGAAYAIKIMDNYDQFSKNALDKGKGYYASAIVPKIIQEIKSVIEKQHL